MQKNQGKPAKQANVYQSNGMTVKAPRPEKGGTHANVKRGDDLRVKSGKKN